MLTETKQEISITRPFFDNNEDVASAVKEITPFVLVWAVGLQATQQEYNSHKIETELFDAYRYASGDGYEMARYLEDHSEIIAMRNPNAVLVAILDDVRHKARLFVENKEKEWVAANGIHPIQPGTPVRCIDDQLCGIEGQISLFGTGIVVSCHSNGKARVTFPHQTEGQSYSINWEHLEVVD
jgi:hypothetical protein